MSEPPPTPADTIAASHRLADERLAPRAAEIDARRAFPAESFRALAEADLLGLMVPKEWGGGAGLSTFVAVCEEPGRGGIADATWLQQVARGAVDPDVIGSFWTTPGYDNGNFTALPDFDPGRARGWSAAVLAMDHADPRWRPSMDLEGVGRWMPGQKDSHEVVMTALPP